MHALMMVDCSHLAHSYIVTLIRTKVLGPFSKFGRIPLSAANREAFNDLPRVQEFNHLTVSKIMHTSADVRPMFV